jgi:cell division protein ZapA (FtsZ GTPase activity inhibitor)
VSKKVEARQGNRTSAENLGETGNPGGISVARSDSSPVTRTIVTIYGEDYPLVSDLPPEAVHALGRMVDTRLRMLAARHPRVPSTRLSILAALTLAEELARAKSDQAEAEAALQAQWRRESPTRRAGKGGPSS